MEHTILHSGGGSCEVLIVLSFVNFFCKPLPDCPFHHSKGISYSALAVSDNGTFVGTGTMSEVYQWKLSITFCTRLSLASLSSTDTNTITYHHVTNGK